MERRVFERRVEEEKRKANNEDARPKPTHTIE
jgi:hypothetical protein